MQWKRSFFAIFLAEGLAVAGFSTSMPIIPFFFQDLGVHGTSSINFWNGITQAGSAVALALFAPIWGALADHYGRRRMLLRAMFGGAVIVGLMAFVTAPWQLFALRVFQGAVTGTVAAATVLTASIVPEKEIGLRLGLLQAAVFVGGSIGPLFGGVIADAMGHREVFFATTLFLLLAGFLILGFVKEDFVPKPVKGRVLKKAIPNFKILSADTGLIALFIMIFAVQLSSSVVNPILPLFIQAITPNLTILGTATGIILGSAAISGAAASAVIGRIADRTGYSKTLGVCMAGSLFLYIPQGLVQNWQQLLVLRFIGGIFMGGTMPAVNALISKRTLQENRGSVFGLSTSVASLGMALGPALGAVAASLWGYPSVFFITSGILAISSCTILLVKTGRINRIIRH